MKLDRSDPLPIHQRGPIQMRIYWVRSDDAQEYWGPYTSRPLAERVNRIACMAGYEDAEVAEMDCDSENDRLMAGMLPWRIIAELDGGKLQKTTCSLTWPPEATEGIIRGEGKDGDADIVEYFAWAKTEVDAKRRIAQLSPEVKADATI